MKMKYLGKRLLSFLLALSMIFTMSSVSSLGQIKVMAEEIVTRLYFELPDNSAANDWGINVWGGAEVVETENHPTITIAPWGDQVKPALLEAEVDGWAFADIRGKIDGLQFVNAKGDEYKCWNGQIAAQNITTAYYSTKNRVWYKDIELKEEIKEAEIQKVFYVVGESDFVGANWDLNAESGKMEQISDNVFSITFKNIKAGTYQYKIIQDPANKAWDLPYGGNDNRSIEVPYKANVTLKIDITDEEKNVEASFEKIEAGSAENVGQLNVAAQVKLLVDGNANDMNLYLNGVYENTVKLESGSHDIALTVNEKNVATRTINVETDEEVTFRYAGDELQDSIQDKLVYDATLVGNFYGLNFVDNNGDSLEIDSWSPNDSDGNLEYIGGGLYKAVFKFAELTEAVELRDGGYKVAFDHSWDYSIGGDSGNIALTIPKGKTELTILVDEINKVVYDNVRSGSFETHHNDGVVKERNSLTTTVTLAGDVNSWSGATGKGYDFSQISENLFILKQTYNTGTYQYKCVFNGSDWFENSGNKSFDVKADGTDVVIVYNAAEDMLYDSINDTNKLSIMLGMAVAPSEMKVIDNKNGTTTFIATGDAGQQVSLLYGDRSTVEEQGASALTKLDLGKIKTDSVATNEIFFGDEELDIVYYYEIDGTKILDSSNKSVTIDGVSYSNYCRNEFKGRTVNVPGTFPGPSWDANSNKMNYLGKGLYSYTFKNVPAANYEYKIAFTTWAENYGVEGRQDGANYSVTVPKTQDVTIYYTDLNTHLSVTSLNYKFVEAFVQGTNVVKTPLKDDGLTGVYSGTVLLEAGTYSDVDLIVDDEINSTFGEFTLEEAKEVTFYYAPDFGIVYNNAADWNADADKVIYDSKNIEYKNPFGAVEEGSDVTFSVKADDKVTDVKLVVKLNETKTYDMKKDGNKWSVTTKFDSIGEYDYFFVVYTGSAVKVYCDDFASDYGKGVITELTSINPYDLVVYEKGFKTPDWMKNAVIYQIFPDRFYNADKTNDQAQTSSRGEVDYEYVTDWYALPENPEQEALLSPDEYAATGAYAGDSNWSNEIYGGDLKGIVEKIDYLKALGVNVIYLNPVFSSISSHRYDTSDYRVIDPILGTEGDFDKLVKVAQDNGMHIVLDGVFNHVSDDSIYFDRYYKFLTAKSFDGKIGAYPYWAYVYDLMSENADLTKEEAEASARDYFKTNYNVSDFSYTGWFDIYTSALVDDNQQPVKDGIGLRAGKPVYGYEGWWGYDSMPVIMSTNGSEYQTGTWAQEIIEGSDSVGQYWISKGSNGWRLDVANEVSDETWQHFRDSVKGLDSDAVIIGEIWDDATEYLMGDMYDSVMNYVFRGAVTGFAKGESAVNATASLEKIRERYPREAFYAMMNLVGSHDTTRLLSYLDGIDDDRNQKDIDKAFPTYEKTSDAAKERQYLVAFLQFTYAGAPTIYYGDEIGMTGSDDPDDRRGFTWGKGNKEIVEWYAKLAAIRSNYPVLRTGDVEPMTIYGAAAENLMGYVRRLGDDEAIILANNSDKAVEYAIDLAAISCDNEKAYTDMISGKEYTVSEGKIIASIPARSGVILTTEAKSVNLDTENLRSAYDPSYVKPDEGEEETKPISITKCKASLEAVEYVYDGKAKTPAVTVVDNEKVLTKDVDYVVGYTNNVNVGTANVTVTGINKYTGKIQLYFTIKGAKPVVDKKQDQTITGVKAQYNKKYGDAKFNLGAKANTSLTFASSNKKVATVDSKGNISIKGVGVTTITIKAVETSRYNSATKTVKLVVKKGIQKISVKVPSKTYKKNTLKSAKTFRIGAKASGQLSYKVTKGAKYISVSKSGKVTIKKNAKKGTYVITITAKATSKYNKATKKITIKVK